MSSSATDATTPGSVATSGSVTSPGSIATTTGTAQEELTLMDKVLTALKDPIVLGGLLLIVILIVVALTSKNQKGGSLFSDTSSIGIALTQTPPAFGFN
jgi:hypothetical protein